MECNKDEALRAKEIAERKFTERNYSAAKKFASKAQNLYSGLEGLSQMMTTIDVYVAAENKINGEMDWYGILGVGYLADEDTIRKQYRKLALLLHPDKNKSLGAEGAFKLVSEAWSLLSDRAKRLEYNQKRDLKGQRPKVSTHSQSASGPPTANGYPNFSNATSTARVSQSNTRATATSSQSSTHRKPDTFWTLCNRCKTHYEYLRVYLNHTLLCPNCHEAFLALEKAPPPNVFKSADWSSRQQHQSSRQQTTNNNLYNAGRNSGAAHGTDSESSRGPNSFGNANFQWGRFSRTAGVKGTSTSGVVQGASAVKRERDEGGSAAEWERSQVPLKKNKVDDGLVNNYADHGANQMARGGGGFGLGSSSESGMLGFSGPSNRPNIQQELSIFEIRSMLMEKARGEISEKLKQLSSLTEGRAMNKENKKRRGMANGGISNQKSNGKSSTDDKNQSKKSLGSSSADDLPMGMTVPDPDFHNFDIERSENSFGADQVWAAYDDDDGMPRFYARIHKVISLKPFKMRISWLNSRSSSELGPLDWVGAGFTKTCGDFRIGRHEISGKLNSFSHKVCWAKGQRGAIRILPRKGEVWAIYKNWSPDWNENTPDEVVHRYEMVEVLDDFNEEEGVLVSPLIKVAGFRTVFQDHTDPKAARRIPKEEMFRLSHQVPYYLLTGEEAQNAPKGCRELDPAATPLELLQMVTEAEEEPIPNNNGKCEEGMSPGATETNIMQTESVREAVR